MGLGTQLQGDDGADLVGAFGSPVVLDRIQIAVAAADASTTGRLVLLIER